MNINRIFNCCLKRRLYSPLYSVDLDFKSTCYLRLKAELKTNFQSNNYSKKFISDENNRIWTVPNILCLYRLTVAPLIAHEIIYDNYNLALCLTVSAALTDLFDGMIARHFPSQKSLLGTFLDPLADKVLVASLSLSLWYTGILPGYLIALFIVKDMSMMIGAIVIRYKTMSQHTSLRDIFNPTLLSVAMEPLLISKINTSLQFGLIAASLGAPVWNYLDSPYLTLLQYLCVVTTIGTGLSYVMSKKIRTILKS